VAEPRLCLVIGTFFPEVGGAEVQALNHARALRETGFDVEIVTLRHRREWPASEVIDDVPVRRLGGRVLGNRTRLPGLLRKTAYFLGVTALGWDLWRRRERYDVLCLFQLNLLTVPGAVVSALAGRPLVIQLHTDVQAHIRKAAGSRRREIMARLEATLPRLALRLVRGGPSVIVALSSRTDREARAARLGLPVLHIPNGVDTDRFRPALLTEERSRTVVCVARLAYPKGIDLLLRAWQIVRQRVPEARLIVVGDGPLQSELRRLSTELGNDETVEFAGHHDDVVPQLQRAGIAVLASRWEGMPVALLEAMACGLPAVATRVSGSEDIVQSGQNGFLAEPGDITGLANGLLTLLTDAEKAASFSRAARATIEERYALRRSNEDYAALYRRLAGGTEWIHVRVPV